METGSARWGECTFRYTIVTESIVLNSCFNNFIDYFKNSQCDAMTGQLWLVSALAVLTTRFGGRGDHTSSCKEGRTGDVSRRRDGGGFQYRRRVSQNTKTGNGALGTDNLKRTKGKSKCAIDFMLNFNALSRVYWVLKVHLDRSAIPTSCV